MFKVWGYVDNDTYFEELFETLEAAVARFDQRVETCVEVQLWEGFTAIKSFNL